MSDGAISPFHVRGTHDGAAYHCYGFPREYVALAMLLELGKISFFQNFFKSRVPTSVAVWLTTKILGPRCGYSDPAAAGGRSPRPCVPPG